MNAHDVICLIREALVVAEKQGLRVVESHSLHTLLSEIQKLLGSSTPETSELEKMRLEQLRAQLTVWVSQQEHINAWNLENFRQIIALGQAALRSITLINGGAAVALLAFIGHLVSVTSPTLSVLPFAGALQHFVFGVFFAALASGTTYLSQLAYGGSVKWHHRVGIAFHVATVLLGIGAYVQFFIGTSGAYAGFTSGAP
jgi:hypothetical protein